MRRILPIVLALGLIFALWQLPVWDQGVVDVPADTAPRVSSTAASSGHDHATTAGDTGERDLALKPTGSGSEAELAASLATLHEHDRATFEEAFRFCFAADRDSRDYKRAHDLFSQLLQHDPSNAPSYRGLAYAEFNLSMSFPETIRLYKKAIELDDDYGEAHYALSFMLANSDPATGKIHFDRAMALGVEDERNLGTRFFGGAQ